MRLLQGAEQPPGDLPPRLLCLPWVSPWGCPGRVWGSATGAALFSQLSIRWALPASLFPGEGAVGGQRGWEGWGCEHRAHLRWKGREGEVCFRHSQLGLGRRVPCRRWQCGRPLVF